MATAGWTQVAGVGVGVGGVTGYRLRSVGFKGSRISSGSQIWGVEVGGLSSDTIK